MFSPKSHFASSILSLTVVILAAQFASAQLRLPLPSQNASVKQTIGVTDVTITYSRPGVKGRTIWGDPPAGAAAKGEATLDGQTDGLNGTALVPYGHMWRTGANTATQFEVSDNVLVNGQPLAAGTYSLHSIPGKDEWTYIFNGTANQWGSFSYDAKKDTLRIKAKPQWVNDSQETMIFIIDPAVDISPKSHFASSILSLTVVILAAQFASAQLRLPLPSQNASVKQTIGVTDVTITYSRPGVKGRTIWGDPPAGAAAKGEATLDGQTDGLNGTALVPYGHMWRTGANTATQFEVSDNVLVNGQPLAAGTYSLHSIPGKDEWTYIFNGTANQWGSFSYDAKKDTLRIKAKPQWVNDSQETMIFIIDPAVDNTATVSLRWEKVRVPFTIEVKEMPALVLSKARVSVAAAKADDWSTPYRAGLYANRNKSADDAAKWFEQSLKAVDVSIAAKETFQNLAGKANILLAAGRKAEGLDIADKAIARGKTDKVDTTAFEKRVADIKAGKM